MPALRVVAIALIVLSLAPLAMSKDIALISNKSNGVTDVPLADLVKMSKGQTLRWPDGKPVTIVLRDLDSPDAKLILEKLYVMPKGEVIALINSANHGGTNRPVIILAESDEAIVQKVASTPGAIGMVDVYSITGGIQVVKISGKLPLEPGYPLHGN